MLPQLLARHRRFFNKIQARGLRTTMCVELSLPPAPPVPGTLMKAAGPAGSVERQTGWSDTPQFCHLLGSGTSG